jgi:hypothetical protein
VKNILLAGIFVGFMAGCTPTIRVEVPDKPIEINLNVKIRHEILIKVDNELSDLFEDEADIF